MAIRQRQEPRRVGGERHDELRGEPAANESQSFALSPRTLLLIGAFWTLFGAFQASNWLFAYRVPFSGGVFASALINAYMWALLTPAVFRLASQLGPEGGVGTWRVLRAVGIGIAFTAVTAVVASVTHQELVFNQFGRVHEVVVGPDGYLYVTLQLPGQSLSQSTPGMVARLIPVAK